MGFQANDPMLRQATEMMNQEHRSCEEMFAKRDADHAKMRQRMRRTLEQNGWGLGDNMTDDDIEVTYRTWFYDHGRDAEENRQESDFEV